LLNERRIGKFQYQLGQAMMLQPLKSVLLTHREGKQENYKKK